MRLAFSLPGLLVLLGTGGCSSDSGAPARPDAGVSDADASVEPPLPSPWERSRSTPPAGDARLALTAGGDRVVVWSDDDGVSWRLAPRDGAPSEPQLIEGLTADAEILAVANTSTGVVLVTEDEDVVERAIFSDGTWSELAELPTGTDDAVVREALVHANGRISLLVNKLRADEIGVEHRVEQLTVDADQTLETQEVLVDEADPESIAAACSPQALIGRWWMFADRDGQSHVFCGRGAPEGDGEEILYFSGAGAPEVVLSDPYDITSLDVAFADGGAMHLAYVRYEDVDGTYWPHIHYRAGLDGEESRFTSGVEESSSSPRIRVSADGAIYIVTGSEFLDRYPAQIFGLVSTDDGVDFERERVSDEEIYSRRPESLLLDPETGELLALFQVPLDSDGNTRPESGWWIATRPPGTP